MRKDRKKRSTDHRRQTTDSSQFDSRLVLTHSNVVLRPTTVDLYSVFGRGPLSDDCRLVFCIRLWTVVRRLSTELFPHFKLQPKKFVIAYNLKSLLKY